MGSTMLLIRQGRPVPWITRWTSEVCHPGPRLIPIATPRGWRLTFGGEVPEDRIDGLLWLREKDSPGLGEPLWRDVHSHRQRLCQMEGRCQVCGEVIKDDIIPWLIPAGQMAQRRGASIITDVAPTCPQCIPTAVMACPHLAQNVFHILNVTKHRPWGVFGDIVDPTNGTRPTHYQGDRQLTGYLGNVMARHMIVELCDYRRRRP